jgi:hypothetical protein
VGRVKRHRRLSAPEVLAANMPAELNMLEFCSTVEGLRFEQVRIGDWLEQTAPHGGRDLLPAVLQLVGFETAEWYRRVLSQPAEGCGV